MKPILSGNQQFFKHFNYIMSMSITTNLIPVFHFDSLQQEKGNLNGHTYQKQSLVSISAHSTDMRS